MSIAARVASAQVADDWLDGFAPPDAPSCLEAESNVGGELTLEETPVGSARVVLLLQVGPDTEFTVAYMADGTTVAALVLVGVGTTFDPAVAQGLRDELAGRLSS